MKGIKNLISRQGLFIYLPTIVLVLIAYYLDFSILPKLATAIIGGVIGYLLVLNLVKKDRISKDQKSEYERRLYLLVIGLGLVLPFLIANLGALFGTLVFIILIIAIFLRL